MSDWTCVKIGVVVAFLMSVFGLGCGRALPEGGLEGDWAYAWETNGVTLHGTLSLEQDGDVVSGPIGYPVDDTQGVQDIWKWEVSGTLSGDKLELLAPPPPMFYTSWRFDCTVSDALDCLGYAEGVYKGTFTASR